MMSIFNGCRTKLDFFIVCSCQKSAIWKFWILKFWNFFCKLMHLKWPQKVFHSSCSLRYHFMWSAKRTTFLNFAQIICIHCLPQLTIWLWIDWQAYIWPCNERFRWLLWPLLWHWEQKGHKWSFLLSWNPQILTFPQPQYPRNCNFDRWRWPDKTFKIELEWFFVGSTLTSGKA